MYNDAIDLRDFYASSMGRTAQRIVRRYIRSAWPDVHGMNIAGIGYATPYLRPFMEEADRVVALMPAQQGVIRWPADRHNVTSLSPDDDLPLPDVSMDRVLLVHSLECSEHLRSMLREVWRVMTEGGRVLIVVPNRRGIWARIDQTPFGHGHPYTPRQLSRLLRDNLFLPDIPIAGLFMPPSKSRMMLGAAPALEKIGFRWFKTFGGVLMIEAQKQIYAGSGTADAVPARRRSYVRVVGGTERHTLPSAAPPEKRTATPETEGK